MIQRLSPQCYSDELRCLIQEFEFEVDFLCMNCQMNKYDLPNEGCLEIHDLCHYHRYKRQVIEREKSREDKIYLQW